MTKNSYGDFQLRVEFWADETVDIQDRKFARGPFALQYAPGVVKDKGVIKFRKVEIKTLWHFYHRAWPSLPRPPRSLVEDRKEDRMPGTTPGMTRKN